MVVKWGLGVIFLKEMWPLCTRQIESKDTLRELDLLTLHFANRPFVIPNARNYKRIYKAKILVLNNYLTRTT